MQVPLLAVTQPTCVAASSRRASNPNPCNGDNGDGASQECLLVSTEKKSGGAEVIMGHISMYEAGH